MRSVDFFDEFKRYQVMKRFAVLSLLCLAAAVVAMQGQVSQPPFKWFTAGAGLVLPRELTFENASGRLGILTADVLWPTKGILFLEALGPNGRAGATCLRPPLR